MAYSRRKSHERHERTIRRLPTKNGRARAVAAGNAPGGGQGPASTLFGARHWLLLLIGGLAYGASRTPRRIARSWRPPSSSGTLSRPSASPRCAPPTATMIVSLPATTLAFAAANIFARANGYIETRKVDIGDQCEGWRSAGADYRSRARSPDRAGRGHAQPEPGDVAADAGQPDLARSPTIATASGQERMGDAAAGRHRPPDPRRPNRPRSVSRNRTSRLSRR